MKNVAFLTGAGISVASGLPTFRGPGGLWEKGGVKPWATAAGMAKDPVACWRAHRGLMRLVAAARPNVAHAAIATLEPRQPGTVTVITQNIDGLHQRAGSNNVIEIHGSLARIRCTNALCDGTSVSAPDASLVVEEPPACPLCGNPMRYDIVLFDEYLSPENEWAAQSALRGCDLFVAVGTSGTVSPASNYVREAQFAGARTVFVNTEPTSNDYFGESHIGPAEKILPKLLGSVV